MEESKIEEESEYKPGNVGPKKMRYKDEGTGDIVYGYSQKNLDKIYKLGWAMVILLGLAFIVFGGLAVYMLWKMQRWDIVGKFLRALRG